MAAEAFTIDDVKRILVERVGLNEADVPDDPEATFDSMGLDSLAFVEIQLAMQQEYGFTIPDEDAERITTIGESVEYVNQRLREGDETMAAHTDNSVVIGAPRDFVWERMMDVELARPVQRVRQGRGDRAGWRHDPVPPDDPSGPGLRRSGVELGLRAGRRPRRLHVEVAPDRDRAVRVHEHRVVLRGGRGRHEHALGPGLLDEAERAANDEQAEEYMNKNTKEQMGVIKERLERAAPKAG